MRVREGNNTPQLPFSGAGVTITQGLFIPAEYVHTSPPALLSLPAESEVIRGRIIWHSPQWLRFGGIVEGYCPDS